MRKRGWKFKTQKQNFSSTPMTLWIYGAHTHVQEKPHPLYWEDMSYEEKMQAVIRNEPIYHKPGTYL